MFGLFMLLLFIGARFVYVILQRKEELDWRDKSRRDGRSLWVDRNGTAHHIENDEPFMIFHDYKDGNTYEKNPYTGEIKKNLTAEYKTQKTIDEKQRAIAEGRRFYTIDPLRYDFTYPVLKTVDYKKITVNYKGRRWIDVNTGKTYVRRYIGNPGTAWYINTETGLYEFIDEKYLDGEWDIMGYLNGHYCRFKNTSDNIEQSLNEMNEVQRKEIEKYGLDSIDSRFYVWHNDRVNL